MNKFAIILISMFFLAGCSLKSTNDRDDLDTGAINEEIEVEEDKKQDNENHEEIVRYGRVIRNSTSGETRYSYYDIENKKDLDNWQGYSWFFATIEDINNENKISEYYYFVNKNKSSVFKITGMKGRDDCEYYSDGQCLENIIVKDIELVNDTSTPVEKIEKTEIVQYKPPKDLPSDAKDGYCWNDSLAAPFRNDTWRCSIGNEITDPCFSLPQSDRVFCPIDPRDDSNGYQIKLTQPLPVHGTARAQGKEKWPWFIELENGSECHAYTGEAPVIDKERVNYSCGLLGDLTIGKIWTAKQATISLVDAYSFKADSIETVRIKKVWQ